MKDTYENIELARVLEMEQKLVPADDPEGYVKGWANHFREAGMTKLEISFSGSGDDGSIDDIRIFRGAASGQYGESCHNNELSKVLEEWAYSLLGTCNVDWVNNEGGFGHIHWDLEENEFNYEVYYRIVSEELGASDTIELV